MRGLSSLEAQFPNRTDWWVAKITRTMERDKEVTIALEDRGWTVLRFWESDILADSNHVSRSIALRVHERDTRIFRSLPSTALEQRRYRSVRLGKRLATRE